MVNIDGEKYTLVSRKKYDKNTYLHIVSRTEINRSRFILSNKSTKQFTKTLLRGVFMCDSDINSNFEYTSNIFEYMSLLVDIGFD